MFYGISDERLQDQPRNRDRRQRIGEVDIDLQPLGEANLFDCQIEPLHGDLVGERHVRRRITREAAPKESRQGNDHLFGVGIAPGEDERLRLPR